MNELVEKVAERAGINADQGTQAVEAAVEQLRDELPAPIASQLRGFLDGRDDGDGPDIGRALKGLGGIFGR